MSRVTSFAHSIFCDDPRIMPHLNQTHDRLLRSWIESANDPDCDFPIQNLPLGVFRRRGSSDPPRIGVAIGQSIFDVPGAVPGNAHHTTRDPGVNHPATQV